jgi:hypothetical protein
MTPEELAIIIGKTVYTPEEIRALIEVKNLEEIVGGQFPKLTLTCISEFATGGEMGDVKCLLVGPHTGRKHYHAVKNDEPYRRFWTWTDEEAVK